MSKKLTLEEVKSFVESLGLELLSEEYNNQLEKLLLKCSCGNTFYSTYKWLKRGDKIKCEKCSINKRAKLRSNSYDHVKNFIEVESNSGCKLLTESYINTRQKLDVKCKCGKVFKVSFLHFKTMNKRQCNECGIEMTIEKTSRTHNEFVELVNDLGEHDYSVLSEYKNATTKVLLKHDVCGCCWEVKPYSFINLGSRCPKCNESKGEKNIEQYLKENNIKYKPQYKIDDCRNIKSLPFDFAIFDSDENVKSLIEYDGELHYKSIEHFGGDEQLEKQKCNDKIKDIYCENKNIPLLRIPYWEFSNIENILKSTL